MNWLNELIEFLLFNLSELFRIDWTATQFKEKDFAIRAAITLIAALLLKKLWPHLRKRLTGKTKFDGYEHSGYRIEKWDKAGSTSKMFALITRLTAIIGILFFLVALADPYQTISHHEKLTESREIVYLKDTSVSMAWRFKNSRQARGQIVQEFLLKMIASRKDKKDKAAYITFASYPELEADFTSDNNSLLFSVYNGPIVTADPSAPEIYPQFMLKDFKKVPWGGGTNLLLGLHAAIKTFDGRTSWNKDRGIRNKSIVIITDGASEEDPEPEFIELSKRGIIPHLIFIDPDQDVEKKLWGENSPKVKLPQEILKQVLKYGGNYWLATNQYSLAKIGQELDKLHGSITKERVYTTEQHLYRFPLTASFVFLILAIVLRLLFWWTFKVT